MRKTITKKEKFNFHFDEILYQMLYDTKDNAFFRNEVKCYIDLVRQFGNSYKKKGDNKSQFYKTEFFYDDTRICSYEIEWNIDSAMEIIQRDKIQPISFSISSYQKFFHEETLNEIRKIFTAGDNTPVIVVEYPMIYEPKLVLIDGNHRYYNALNKGKRTIPAFRLTVAQSLECMQNDTFRDLFKIHHNICQIILAKKSNSRDLIFAENGNDNTLFQLHNGLFSRIYSKWLLLLYRTEEKHK